MGLNSSPIGSQKGEIRDWARFIVDEVTREERLGLDSLLIRSRERRDWARFTDEEERKIEESLGLDLPSMRSRKREIEDRLGLNVSPNFSYPLYTCGSGRGYSNRPILFFHDPILWRFLGTAISVIYPILRR